MQKVVQNVLKLTAKCEPKLWTELESQLVASAPKLKQQELIDVLLHYGDNEKGSSEFWNSMSKHVQKNFNNYNAGEIMNLFDAFSYAATQYKFPKEFNKSMVDGVHFAAKKLGQGLDSHDPAFRPFVNQTVENEFEQFKTLDDPFLEFQDDLKIEKKSGKDKDQAIEIKNLVKDWQKEFLKMK